MQTKYLSLTAIFLLGLSATAAAQSEPAQGAFDGLQSSLNQFKDTFAKKHASLKPKFDEYLRLAWLASDIRMRMNAHLPTEMRGSFYYWASYSHGSIYAEFDWENRAQSMRVKSSESKQFMVSALGTLKTTDPAQDFYMYMDAEGYWYVPTEDKTYRRINAMGGMRDVAELLEVNIEAAIENNVTAMIDYFATLASINYIKAWKVSPDRTVFGATPHEVGQLIGEYLNQLGGIGPLDRTQSVSKEKLESLLKELAKVRYQQIKMFPPLIHFAYIISPTMVRTQFNVQESTVTWRGQDNCTKMTLVSGKDKGYQIVFDRYGRLIHLRDTDGDTADYWYDKDVTVNIPAATTLDFKKLMTLN